MSESAGKTFRGLQEAYASMYSNNSDNLTEETIVSEVQEEQEFEINEEALYESAIGYLIHFGYASDEKKAAAMIPHMSEQWMTEFLIHDILAENFVIAVNTLLEEGKDLSGYTWNELYEGYCSNATENLNEALPLALPAAASALPWIVGGVGALGTLWKSMNRKPTQPAGPSTWDYGQSGTSTYKPKPKPAPVVKAQVTGDTGETERPRLRGTATRPPGSTETQPGPAVSTPASSTPAPGGGGGGDNGDKKEPEPPKDKGPNWIQRKWEQLSKGVQADRQKAAAEKAARETTRQTTGKPSGMSRLGQAGSWLGRTMLKPGLGVLGADLLSGGLNKGLSSFGQGASTQALGDLGKLIWQGQKLGPGYSQLKQNIKGTGSPEQKPAPRPATSSQRNPYGL